MLEGPQTWTGPWFHGPRVQGRPIGPAPSCTGPLTRGEGTGRTSPGLPPARVLLLGATRVFKGTATHTGTAPRVDSRPLCDVWSSGSFKASELPLRTQELTPKRKASGPSA